MGMTEITIELKALANTSTIRSERGIVCLILDEPTVTGVHTYSRLRNVTDSYSANNKAIITRCFSTRGVKILKVVCYNSAATEPETVDVALTALDGVKFNYLADPFANEADNLKIATFIKAQREANNILVKSVLNNHASDYEGDINFINSQVIMADNTVYTGAEFTVDVACVAANCGLTNSLTNMAISDVKSVDVVGSDLDTLVEAGKLFLFYDNDLEQVVFSRAVNSKTTLSANEKESLKKIRIIDILDMVRDDMKVTFKKHYQGQVGNSLANKKLLVSAYNVYLRGLATAGALSNTQLSYVELDVEAAAAYLETEKSYDCSAMTDAEILAIDTDNKVFIKGKVYILDAMEDLDLVLQY